MNTFISSIEILKMAFRVTNPWKSNQDSLEYNSGWDDCLKTLKKNQKKVLKELRIIEKSMDSK